VKAEDITINRTVLTHASVVCGGMLASVNSVRAE